MTINDHNENKWQPAETMPNNGQFLIYQPIHESGRTQLKARIVLNDDGGGVRKIIHWMPPAGAPS